MEYGLIDPEYHADVIAQQLHARQIEYYHYDLDRQNFEHMLVHLTDEASRNDILNRLKDTKKQMAIVDHIYNALKAQIKDEAEHQAAVERFKAKQKG